MSIPTSGARRLTSRNDVRHLLRDLREDILSYMDEYGLRGIAVLIDGSWEGAVTLAAATSIASQIQTSLSAFYIPHGRAVGVPRDLARWAKTKRIVIKNLRIRDASTVMRAYLSEVTGSGGAGITYSLSSIVARAIADKNRQFLLGRYTYTQWILGEFDTIEMRAVDYHPLIKTYYSDLPIIASYFGMEGIISKLRIDPRLARTAERLGLDGISTLDNLLARIVPSSGLIDEESLRKMGVTHETVENLIEKIYLAGIKREWPSPLP